MMHPFKEFGVLLREKSGKKLVAFSVIIFLLITAIVFFATYKLCEQIQLQLMDEYLWEIPEIINSYRDELHARSSAYEDDALSRAELGLIVYGKENSSEDLETLERVREAVSADSVSILNEQGELISTTGPASPEDSFRACIRSLEPRLPELELYPAPAEEDGTDPDKYDGRLFVRIPVAEDSKQSLVFEFSCGRLLKLYNVLNDWSYMLDNVLSGGDVAAYAKTGNRLEEYSQEGIAPEEKKQLYEELTKIFQSSESFRSAKNGSLGRLITLLGRQYLAVLMQYPQGEAQEETEILLTLALQNVIANGFYIAAAISIIIGLGIFLIQFYVFRRLLRKDSEKDGAGFTGKRAIRAAWQGLLIVLAATAVFSVMLLLLESRTNVAFITETKRTQLEYGIGWRRDEGSDIQDTFVELYRTRAQILADFLTKYPDYQTRAGLEELSRVAKTDYLMLFDGGGLERCSSNSYTGFAVGQNLSEEYGAMLLGYPCVVVGPSPDAYTGADQLGAAILMKDSAGRPGGFLLAVYDSGEMKAALKKISYEYTVSNQTVREGYIAAAISEEDGVFIAHTDPKMIGRKMSDYIEDYVPGTDYEGFVDYGEVSMCISARSKDGKTLMFMVPERGDAFAQAIHSPLYLAALLILALLYYPAACALVARAMAEAKEKLPPDVRTRKNALIFIDGYSVFLTLFVIFVLIASCNGWWTSFDYVLSREWSHGVHLFSIWLALFILAFTGFCLFVLRGVFSYLESQISLRSRTVTRLVSSLISYAASFFLFFYILSIFGVNTTALVASAGIVSIAVGMGAQSMASDLLAGFFMMLEGSIHVGDRVTVGTPKDVVVTGVVTDIGIRTTVIVDDQGTEVVLNNSKVSPIRNMTREQMLPEPEKEKEKENR